MDLVLKEVKVLVILKNRVCVTNWRKDSEESWTPVFGDSDQVGVCSWIKLSYGRNDSER